MCLTAKHLRGIGYHVEDFTEEKLGIVLSLTKYLCEKLLPRVSYCVISRRPRACCAVTRGAVRWEATVTTAAGMGVVVAKLLFQRLELTSLSVQGVLSPRAADQEHNGPMLQCGVIFVVEVSEILRFRASCGH